MVHLLKYRGLHSLSPKRSVPRRYEGLFFLHQLQSFRPCYVSCNLSPGRNDALLLSCNGSTWKQPIIKFGKDLRQQQVRSLSSSYSVCTGTQAGINFFRKKRPEKQSKSVESILIRSVIYFVAKQNFLFDFLVNNWSEYNRIVLNADGDGGEGGGFTFLRGFGGGDDNFSRKKKNASLKWWWVLLVAIVLSLLVLSGIRYGYLKLASNYFDARRLKGLLVEVGSFGLLTLVLIVIVGGVVATGLILVGSVKFLVTKSKSHPFSPKGRTHYLSLLKSISAGTLLSIMGLVMLYPKIPRALAEKIYCYVEWFQETTDNQMRAALMFLSTLFMSIRSHCQRKTAALVKTASTKGNKGRSKRGGKTFY